MEAWNGTVIGDSGRPVPLATVLVRTQGVSSPLPNIYDPATGNSLDNPFTADALGNAEFMAADGLYQVEFTGSGLSQKIIRRVALWDPTTASAAPFSQVSLTAPTDVFTVGGSPAGAAGTLSLTKASVNANRIAAGPSSGAAAAWTFRAMVMDDLPAFGPTPSVNRGSATQTVTLTTDAGGRITAISQQTVTPAYSNITGLPTTIEGYGITNGLRSLFVQTASQTIGNTTTETTLWGSGTGSLTIGANTLSVGTVIEREIAGYIKGATTTITIKSKFGSVTLYTANNGGYSGYSMAATKPFRHRVRMTILTLGATGTALVEADTRFGGASANGTDEYHMADGYVVGTVTIDTTVNNTLDDTFTWGTSSVNSTITTNCGTLDRKR